MSMEHYTPLLMEIITFYLIFLKFLSFFVAPEAQRETVFVCAACNSSLIKLQ